MALSKGESPFDREWIIRKRTSQFSEKYGELPGTSKRPFAIEEQSALVDIVKGSDLKYLAANATFPDWLGYVGLVLFFTEEYERESRALTKALIPQLMEGVESKEFKGIFESGLLSWKDLEEIEWLIKDQKLRYK